MSFCKRKEKKRRSLFVKWLICWGFLDRRNPPEKDKLDMIVNILGLSEEEKDLMFNLAGRRRNTVAPDLPEYIMERDYVSSALRTARDLNASEEEWMAFVEELKKRKG